MEDNKENVEVVKVENKKGNEERVHSLFSRFFRFVGRLIKKGNSNYLRITKEGREPIEISLTITGVMLIIAFWLVFIIMVAGLFCGYNYSLVGPNCSNKMNDYLGKAADTASDIKNEFKDGYKN
ncbi:MAG: DUF4342 domain-containing protein [Clostridiaceae bacterium]|nr:DUF4342 domain-containing protein [Clostridiaceae bacterium]